VNVGEAITAGMRADRHRDFEGACWGKWGTGNIDYVKAWLWWGWSLMGMGGRNHLGFPGYEMGAPYRTPLPYISHNRWVRQ
jgi:hypothetical protein